MKIANPPSPGSATIVALCTVSIIGISLASYLTLSARQNLETAWSQYWNLEIPVAEAGLEEALTHIFYFGPTNLVTNGWALVNNQYTKTRYLNSNSYFVVKINSDPNAIIVAEGYLRDPLKTNFLHPRRIQVNTRRDGLFAKGMVAKGVIDLSGNNITSDSFDSSDPNYSTGGRYDPAKRKGNGDIATNSGLTNSINIGNADISGRVATGPGGSISVGPNGAAGSLDWVSNPLNAGKIQTGWATDDMNVSFPDVQMPFTSDFSVPSGDPLLIASSGNWKISGDLTKSLLVKSNVQAVVLVTGNVSLNGSNDKIEIQPGASLQFYVQGASTTLKGKGVINNAGTATNFCYYGLPTNTKLAFGGNASFTGAIYAPNADFTLGGGGSDWKDFVGASVTKTTVMNGHFKFHYDESLAVKGPKRGYVVTNWFEI